MGATNSTVEVHYNVHEAPNHFRSSILWVPKIPPYTNSK